MKKKCDFPLAIVITVFIILGLFVLTSASLNISSERFGQPYYYIFHQIIFGLIPGIIFLFLGYKFNYRNWKKFSLPLMIIAIILMSLVLFVPKLSFFYGGAKRWLSYGFISFQPSEFLKFAFVLYLASWFEKRPNNISSFKFGLLPFAIMSGFVASFLILQPDIGTLFVLLLVVFSLFFLSGGKIKQMTTLILTTLGILCILVAAEPYRLSRILVFINPSHDIVGSGYQLNQGLISIGSGGIFGKGFGLSTQKTGFLPEVIGDSIFAIVAEELGFVGGIFLIFILLFIFFRGVYVVNMVRDNFGKLLGIGILLIIIFQATINVAAISGLIPLTGIPLSFISYGGSALAIMMGEMGIFLNISKNMG